MKSFLLVRRISCYVIVLSVFFTANVLSKELPVEQRSVVVLFGDSITVGANKRFGDITHKGSTDRGCPTIYLTAILKNEGPRPANGSCETVGLSAPTYNQNEEVRNAIVASWGHGGTTTTTGNIRISSNLNKAKALFPGKDHTVLILYGTNDFGSQVSSVTTRSNTVNMIRKARAAGFTPIIGLLTPRDDRTGTGPASIFAYNQRIASAANQEGAQIVDHYSEFVNYPTGFFSLLDQELFFSGLKRLHPNNQGYLVIAEKWFNTVLKDSILPVKNVNIAPIISLLLD